MHVYARVHSACVGLGCEVREAIVRSNANTKDRTYSQRYWRNTHTIVNYGFTALVHFIIGEFKHCNQVGGHGITPKVIGTSLRSRLVLLRKAARSTHLMDPLLVQMIVFHLCIQQVFDGHCNHIAGIELQKLREQTQGTGYSHGHNMHAY